jgi:hypothetical protein
MPNEDGNLVPYKAQNPSALTTDVFSMDTIICSIRSNKPGSDKVHSIIKWYLVDGTIITLQSKNIIGQSGNHIPGQVVYTVCRVSRPVNILAYGRETITKPLINWPLLPSKPQVGSISNSKFGEWLRLNVGQGIRRLGGIVFSEDDWALLSFNL